MSDLFLTAPQARYNATDNITINNEVNAIQNAILTAVGNGLLEVQVTTSLMTLPTGSTPTSASVTAERYFQVWQNLAVISDLDVRVKQLQMTTIIGYFQGLSYGIGQKSAVSGSTFYWDITW